MKDFWAEVGLGFGFFLVILGLALLAWATK